ncbi:Alpha/Beta hydrolase protein [Plectosphaerella plurivora]|uniref:Carboxylic ester hydrolase n=1 Tax=Plectosphaerella plurivora TaxID=936078 RepID=A0A9P8VDK5_9PEZI|nr:Alpha/Beta hydrolase protein [Plectosphaerella plurivora]
MFSPQLVCLLGLATAAATAPLQDAAPVVHLSLGSYYGISNSSRNVDQFLGIPFAQPPVGDLRFRHPQPITSAWDDVRNATSLQSECYQFSNTSAITGSEDCLTINVVRPAGVVADAKLPVAIWIHGGGLVGGSNSNPVYDLSFFVEESARIGKPVIAAAVNYRLHAFGYLWGSAIEAEGAGNLGFRDQRLALGWVRDNVAAFGGDPEKITIWGQSGGARGVASQLTAFGGRDDNLFRGAIMESATGFHTDFGEVRGSNVTWDGAFASVLERVGCSAADNSLDCLRGVDSTELANVFGQTIFPSWLDIVDGDFIQAPRAQLVREGKFVHVPIINGITTDDGDYFAKRPINTDAEWRQWLREGGAADDTIDELSRLYPDDPAVGLPATFQGRPTGELAEEYGSQWKRAVAFGGDRAMQAPRRAWVHAWAAAGLTAYSYRFNVLSGQRPPIQGVGHSEEVAFVLHNLGLLPSTDPKVVVGAEKFSKLADVMTGQWVNFVTDLDPNDGKSCTRWPAYEVEGGENLLYVLETPSLTTREEDTFRAEEFAYLDIHPCVAIHM